MTTPQAKKNGYSIIEIIIALALFAILIVTVGSWLLSNWQYIEGVKDRTQAKKLAQDGLAAAATIRNRAWNEFRFSTSSLFLNGYDWQFAGEGSSEEIGKFTRIIKTSPLYVDGAGNLSPNRAAGEIDPLAKDIAVLITWSGPSKNYEYLLDSRLTDWHAKRFEQTDWSGGPGEIIYLDGKKYDLDDGNIAVGQDGFVRLKEIATSTFAQTGELISGAYYSSSSAYSVLAYSADAVPGCPECLVKIQTKTATGGNEEPEEWSSEWCGPDGQDGDETDFFTHPAGELIAVDHNGLPWVKYRVQFSGNGSDTPVLRSIKVYYHDN